MTITLTPSNRRPRSATETGVESTSNMTPVKPLREGSASATKPLTLAAFAKTLQSSPSDARTDGVSVVAGALKPLASPTGRGSGRGSAVNSTLEPLGPLDACREGGTHDAVPKDVESQLKTWPTALPQLIPLRPGSTENKVDGEQTAESKTQSENKTENGHEDGDPQEKVHESARGKEKSALSDAKVAHEGEPEKKSDQEDMAEFVYMESSDEEEIGHVAPCERLNNMDDLYEAHEDGATWREAPAGLRADQQIYVPHAPKEELFHAILSEDVPLLSHILSSMDPSSVLEVHDNDSRTVYHYAALSQSPRIQAVVFGFINCFHLQESDDEAKHLHHKQRQLAGWCRSRNEAHGDSTWVAPGMKNLLTSIREKIRSDYVTAMERLDCNGRSIFHYSAMNRHYSVLSSSAIFGPIASAGRHVALQRDAFGRTALEYATMTDNPAGVKNLFKVLKIGQLLSTSDIKELSALTRSKSIQKLLYELLEASDQATLRHLEEKLSSSDERCQGAGLGIQFASLIQKASGLRVNTDMIPRSRLRSSLHKAALYGSIESVMILIDEGADVNSRDANGWTPLHHCAVAGSPSHIHIAQVLLEHRADADATSVHGRTPLHLCAQNRAPQAVHKQADDNSSTEDTAIASLLHDHGAKLDVRDEDGLTPFLYAVKSCNVSVAQFLLSAGADPLALDKSGGCCMHIAAARGNEEIVSFLSRWDIECPTWRHHCDHQGRLPHVLARSDDIRTSMNHLWSAVRLGELDMVKHHLGVWKRERRMKVSDLMPLGPNDTTFREKKTALHLVIEGYTDYRSSDQGSRSQAQKFVQIAYALLESGAAVSKRDEWGITPLMLAASVDTPMFVEAMLQYAKPKDVIVTDSTDNTALHYSYAFRRAEISTMLEDAIDDANISTKEGKTPLDVTGSGVRIFPDAYRQLLQKRGRTHGNHARK